MGIVFGLGAMLAFIVIVFALSITDRAKINKRKKQIGLLVVIKYMY